MRWIPRYFLGFGAVLAVVSALTYVAQILIFGRTEDTFYYMVQDLAFVPLQVLLVTLFISEVLRRRELRSRLTHMNMVIGAFFSEVGRALLERMGGFETDPADTGKELKIRADWGAGDFVRTAKKFNLHPPSVDSRKSDLAALKEYLSGKRGFMLALLENPNLLEHEEFTDLLWAMVHLCEELSFREDLTRLPETDLDHLSGDIRRAYGLLIAQWLVYTKHQKEDYPYIFSLVVRTNPFDHEALVELA